MWTHRPHNEKFKCARQTRGMENMQIKTQRASGLMHSQGKWIWKRGQWYKFDFQLLVPDPFSGSLNFHLNREKNTKTELTTIIGGRCNHRIKNETGTEIE